MGSSHRRNPYWCHGWWQNDPSKDENENSVQIDFVNPDQTLESNAKRFVVSIFKHNMIWKKKDLGVIKPSVQRHTITSELNSGHMSFLPRRWVLEIGYLC